MSIQSNLIVGELLEFANMQILFLGGLLLIYILTRIKQCLRYNLNKMYILHQNISTRLIEFLTFLKIPAAVNGFARILNVNAHCHILGLQHLFIISRISVGYAIELIMSSNSKINLAGLDNRNFLGEWLLCEI